MNAVYTNADFQNVILTVLALVVILVMVWCIYTFIRAIIMFVFSHNKEENKKKWRNSIRFMIIGIILTIVLLFLVPFALRLMKVPAYDVYSPPNVFWRAGELINWLFNLGDIIKQSQQSSELKGQFYQDLTPSDTQSPQPISDTTYRL